MRRQEKQANKTFNPATIVNKEEPFLVTGFVGLGDDGKTTHLLEVWGNISKTNRVKMILPRPRSMLAQICKEYKDELQNIELHFTPFTTPRKNKLMLQAITLLLYEVWVSFYLLISKPSLVYTRTSLSGLIPLLAKLKRIPLIIEVNGIAALEILLYSNSRFTKLLANILALVERASYSMATGIITVTEGLKDYLVKVYHLNPDKIWVLENGANTELFQSMEQRKVKQELGLSTEHCYVTFVGELSPDQGVEHLIEAAPLILKKAPTTRFLIVGDGPEKAKWGKLVISLGLDSAFTFTGRVPYQSVPIFICASDVCVALMHRLKTGALKIWEYLSCGIPIVATNNPCLDIFTERQCGILVDSKDPQQVATAILKLLGNKKLARDMGKKGREYVMQNHSWKSVAQNVSQICREVMH